MQSNDKLCNLYHKGLNTYFPPRPQSIPRQTQRGVQLLPWCRLVSPGTLWSTLGDGMGHRFGWALWEEQESNHPKYITDFRTLFLRTANQKHLLSLVGVKRSRNIPRVSIRRRDTKSWVWWCRSSRYSFQKCPTSSKATRTLKYVLLCRQLYRCGTLTCTVSRPTYPTWGTGN